MLNAVVAMWLAAAPIPPELEKQLIEAGKQTQKKSGAARWTVRQKLGTSVDMVLDVVTFGDTTRFDFSAQAATERWELATIVATKDVWVTAIPDQPTKVSRPWEVELPNPSCWLLLAKSDVTVFNRALPGAVVKSDDGNTVTLGSEAAPKLEIVVDKKTGILLHRGEVGRGQFFENIAFLKEAPAELSVKTSAIPAALDEAAMADTVFFNVDPRWKPGMGDELDGDGVLLNIETGARRRVPNRQGITGQLSFFAKRTRAVAISTLATGGFAPVLIDFVTGESRVLGQTPKSPRFVMSPRVAPDQTSVAVVKMSPPQLDASQLLVIDLATGDERTVASGDIGYVEWLTNDVLVVKRGQDLVKLTRDGKETTLVANATQPLVLDGTRVLYRDRESKEWRIHSGTGAPKRFGDGFKKFYEPTLSPDGKRVLMLENVPEIEARLIDLETLEVTDVPLGAGRWSYPRWR